MHLDRLNEELLEEYRKTLITYLKLLKKHGTNIFV